MLIPTEQATTEWLHFVNKINSNTLAHIVPGVCAGSLGHVRTPNNSAVSQQPGL